MSDRPTVLVLHSGHNNDLVYQEGLAAGFAPLGCDVIGVSVRDDHARDTAIAAVLEQPDAFLCIVSVSFYGLQLEVGGKPLQEVTSVPLVMWLFDHPAIFRNSANDVLPANAGNVVLAALDQAHIDYWHKYISADTPAVELNLGIGKHPQLPRLPMDLDGYMKREKVAVLPVNLTHFSMDLANVALKIQAMSPVHTKLTWQAIESSVRDLSTPPYRAVEAAAEDRSVELDKVELATITMLTDAYVKLWRRQFVMRQLVDLPVRFHGEGFPEFDKLGRRRKFGTLTMPALFEEYRSARVVINLGPAFPRYVHERILHGMDAGAAVMSDLNPGVAETFVDGEEIIGFGLGDGDAAAKLTDWLERPEDAFRTMEAARRKMDAIHIHGANAKRLYDTITSLKANGWRQAS